MSVGVVTSTSMPSTDVTLSSLETFVMIGTARAGFATKRWPSQ